MLNDHLHDVVEHLEMGNKHFKKWQIANATLNEEKSKNEMELMNRQMEMINQQNRLLGKLHVKIDREMDNVFGKHYMKELGSIDTENDAFGPGAS